MTPDQPGRELEDQMRRIARTSCQRLGLACAPSREDREDIEAAAWEGAFLAWRTWDPSRGLRLRDWMIAGARHAALAEARRLDWLPRSARRRVRAGDTSVTLLAPVSLEAILTGEEDESDPLGAILADEARVEDAVLAAAFRERLGSCVGRLPEPLREVVRRRYWGEEEFAVIGRALGRSTTRAGQRHREALARLRGMMEEEAA